MSESTPGSSGPENVEAAEQAQAETPGAGTERTASTPAAPTPPESPAATPSEPEPSAPKPSAPKPGPPGPGAPKPSALHRPTPRTAPTPTAPAAPVPPVHDAAEAAAAAEFGRVDGDGTVYVRDGDAERSVGQYPGVPVEEALSLYVRRYLDLTAKVALFETRLDSADLAIREIDQTLAKLAEETTEPAAVGDLESLRRRVEQVRTRAAERRAALEAERVAAKERAVEARTEIVEAAEKIAGTDPEKMQWRPAGEELRNLLERWKESQRNGPRIDRPTEEALWKRFSQARTAFDRERRHFFAELEQRNASAKATKEQIVAEAEALQHSTDWGPTTREYRDLMNRWKAAGRAHRKDDDALWARFRAAQDVFFGARDEANAAIDAEYGENLEVKEALLAEAEALLPVKNVDAAKDALRGIQDRWEEAGKVPRADLSRVEGRLRAVESAVRDAEDDKWRRTNPETQARAEGAAAQLEEAITAMETELADAEAAGDERSAEELRGAIAARRAWLEQVVKAAEDSRG